MATSVSDSPQNTDTRTTHKKTTQHKQKTTQHKQKTQTNNTNKKKHKQTNKKHKQTKNTNKQKTQTNKQKKQHKQTKTTTYFLTKIPVRQFGCFVSFCTSFHSKKFLLHMPTLQTFTTIT
jgi:hypothetical protein